MEIFFKKSQNKTKNKIANEVEVSRIRICCVAFPASKIVNPIYFGYTHKCWERIGNPYYDEKLKFFYVNNVITYFLKSGSLGLSTQQFRSLPVFPLKISSFSVLLSITVFGLSDFYGSFSVFIELLRGVQ